MADQEIPPTSEMPAITDAPTRPFRESAQDILVAVGLSLLVFAVYLLPSQWRPLTETAECRVALVAREMLKSGDWTVPIYNGEPRLKKPPLPYWLTAVAAEVLGEKDGLLVSPRAAVLPSAILGALTVFLLILFGSHLFGRPAGVWAGLVLGLSLLFSRFSQLGTGEIPLVFFTTGAMLSAAWIACHPRPGLFSPILFGVSLGLAVLAKWHIPALLVFGALLVEAVRCRRFNLRKVGLIVAGLAIAAAVAVPWCLELLARYPQAVQPMILEMSDAVRVTGHDQNDRLYFYVYQLAGGLLPWTLVLLAAWILTRKRIRQELAAAKAHPERALAQRICSFLAAATLAGFIGMYLVSKQQPYYLLPLFPLLALCAGYVCAQLSRPGELAEERMAWVQLVLGLLTAAVIAVLPLFVATIGWEVTIPLAVLTATLSLVASRQWVEGRPMISGLTLGLAGYALLVGWALVNAEEFAKDSFMRECLDLRKTLETQPKNTRVYSLRTKVSAPRMLYYLNLERLWRIAEIPQEVASDTQTGQAPPQRLLICEGKTATDLGYSVDGKSTLYLLQLPPEKAHELGNKSPKADTDE